LTHPQALLSREKYPGISYWQLKLFHFLT